MARPLARRCDLVSARGRLGRALSWALALTALAFVAWVVPVRDRCWDAAAPASTRVAVSRDAAGCLLHLRSGAMRSASPPIPPGSKIPPACASIDTRHTRDSGRSTPAKASSARHRAAQATVPAA